MDLQSIATESQTLRSTIRDLRSVITTDRERLERHEGELKAALLRLDELESEASVAFASIRAPAAAPPETFEMRGVAPLDQVRPELTALVHEVACDLANEHRSIFGEPAVAAE